MANLIALDWILVILFPRIRCGWLTVGGSRQVEAPARMKFEVFGMKSHRLGMG